ncbi:hypothetical protein NL676_024890 [Syzygium grande]|nr:hypothetical protein NL676_024890 [Syzygium grande]
MPGGAHTPCVSTIMVKQTQTTLSLPAFDPRTSLLPSRRDCQILSPVSDVDHLGEDVAPSISISGSRWGSRWGFWARPLSEILLQQQSPISGLTSSPASSSLPSISKSSSSWNTRLLAGPGKSGTLVVLILDLESPLPLRFSVLLHTPIGWEKKFEANKYPSSVCVTVDLTRCL